MKKKPSKDVDKVTAAFWGMRRPKGGQPPKTNPRKARGTVRPASCCRPRVGGCSAHAPNVALEVRQKGKWVLMGILTPEHQWVVEPTKAAQKRTEALLAQGAA